jgi:hypothetical protein
MDQALTKLHQLLPSITFVNGETFCWSPATQQITYRGASKNEADTWALLHEAGHAALGHARYSSDFELLMMEVAAWQKAVEVAKHVDVKIDTEHIEDCLDTYRDWLHQRSTCPTCSSTSFQVTPQLYRCHNCSTEWTVSTSRFCRAYRKRQHNSKEKRSPTKSTTFI